MRLVIVGTGGRVGGALARHFRLRGHAVIGFDRKGLDLTRPEIIRDRLEPLAFDAVLLPAAITSLDYAEAHPDEARAANVLGPGLIAEICARRKARLVHFSTDYVYDGALPGLRRESDPIDPISVYGHTKAEGERLVLTQTGGTALIARVSWIFGPDRPAFPDQLIDRARTHDSVEAVVDKFSAPTSSTDLGRWLEPFVVGDLDAVGGAVNFCNDGSASWHQYGQTALDLAAGMGVPLRTRVVTPRHLAEITVFKAPRPIHTAMSVDRLTGLLGERPRPWPDALRDYLRTYHAPA